MAAQVDEVLLAPVRLYKMCGYSDRVNDVIYLHPTRQAEKHSTVVFFGGDIQVSITVPNCSSLWCYLASVFLKFRTSMKIWRLTGILRITQNGIWKIQRDYFTRNFWILTFL